MAIYQVKMKCDSFSPAIQSQTLTCLILLDEVIGYISNGNLFLKSTQLRPEGLTHTHSGQKANVLTIDVVGSISPAEDAF